MLPKMDGYKVCRLLKFDERYRKIPVLIFTARAQEEDIQLATQCGSNGYLTKPFEAKVLLEKLEEFFKKHRKPNNKIQKIYVCKGPGSYTGVRIGVTIAQALGFAWHIPVKAVSKAQMDKLLI